MVNKIKIVKEFVVEVNEIVEILSFDQVKVCFDDEKIVFVDIRDVCEFKCDGKFLGVEYVLCGMLEFWFDFELLYYKEVFVQDKIYVFYCVLGWCFVFGVRVLYEMGFELICYMDGGFGFWKKVGYLVED